MRERLPRFRIPQPGRTGRVLSNPDPRGRPVLTAVYLDFESRASHRVWRWLSLLPERDTVEVRPYASSVGGGDSRGPWDRTVASWGLELLALGELARESGHEVHLRYVDAVFAVLHGDRDDVSSPELWLALGSQLGLDLDAFTADSERWRAEVGLWHAEARDDLGVTGVPSLVFDDKHALFVKLDRQVTDAAAGRRLLADLDDLATQPVVEVRKTA